MDTEHEWYVRRAEPYGETFQVNCDTSADAIRITQSWEDAGERGVATNARCESPGCPRPALVPDGLCREHAVEEAMKAMRQVYDAACSDSEWLAPGDPVLNRESREAVAKEALTRILSLGLTPADLEPTQEPPK